MYVLRLLMCAATVVTIPAAASAQILDVGQLQQGVPPSWGIPTGPVAYQQGAPQYGYQFEYGSFVVTPGNPPAVDASFALTMQQFPQGPVQRLYHEQLDYVGFNGSGPYEGAVFESLINGSKWYFLFGTVSQGSQNGVQLRRIRYFDQAGNQKYSTTARFYSP